jgi:UDP-glucose 4-epimerase
VKSLVTGGAGFIGSNIVDKLIELNHEVIVIDNESSTAHPHPYWNSKAKNYKEDISDYSRTRKLYDGVDYVFHLAAESSIQKIIKDPIKATKINTLGTNIVLECSREANIKRLVYSSTAAAYGNNLIPSVETQVEDCLNPYAVSKVNGEKLCKMYTDLFGLETIILRYFNAYGKNQPISGQYAPVMGVFERQKSEGDLLTIVGDGEQKRDFVNVFDIVNANILSINPSIKKEWVGSIFNIGSGINYSINEIAKMYNHPSVNIPVRTGEIRESLANVEKAKLVLGWDATISLEKWLGESHGTTTNND